MNIISIAYFKSILIILLFLQNIAYCGRTSRHKSRDTTQLTRSGRSPHINRNNSNNSSTGTTGVAEQSGSSDGNSGSQSGSSQESTEGQGQDQDQDQDPSESQDASETKEANESQDQDQSQDSTVTVDSKKTGEKEAVELDLKDKKSTDAFDCLSKDGFAKYTPKSGYGFSSVNAKAGGCSGCCGSSITIWSTTEPKDYATAVVRDGASSCRSIDHVTIFFGDIYRHFTKSNKIFVQDSGIRLYRNHSSKPDKKNQLKKENYSEDHSDDLFKFIINDDIQCTEFKYVHRCFKPNSPKLLPQEVSLWKHDSTKHGDQYPKVLRYYWPDKILINFPNIFTTFYKNNDHTWDEGHLFDFKLYGKDSNDNLKAFDLKSYELSLNEKEYRFKFKAEDNCVEVKHKGNELWKHDSTKHGDQYPLTLRYKRDGSTLFMDFERFFVFCYRSTGKKLKAKEFYIHLYKLDASTNELRELDYSEYDLIEDYDEFEFKFNQGHDCDEVKYEEAQVWSYDPIVHRNEHPSLVYHKDSRIIVNFEHYFILYDKDSQDNWKAVELDIKLHGPDPQDASKTVEIPMTKYELTKEGRDYHFKLKDGVMCTGVKHMGHHLWSHDSNKHGDKYPHLVIYNKLTGKVILNFEHMVVFSHKDKSGNWETQDIKVQLLGLDPNNSSNNINLHGNNYHLGHYKDEYEFAFKDGVKTTSFKLEGKDIWSHDATKYGGKHPKQVNYKKDGSRLVMDFDGLYVLLQKNADGNWDPLESITLDISSTSGNAQYDFAENKLIRVFTPKTGYLFGRIDISGTNIYQSEDLNNCSNKVVLRKKGESEIEEVSLILFNGDFKRFNKMEGSDAWYQRLQSLSLDVKMKYNSYYYNYFVSRDMDTYVAKNNFGFKRVRYGLLKVWETDHESTYAYKVTYLRLNGEAEIEIRMYNGETKIFTVKRTAYTDLMPTPKRSYPVTMIEQSLPEDSRPEGVPALRPSPFRLTGLSLRKHTTTPKRLETRELFQSFALTDKHLTRKKLNYHSQVRVILAGQLVQISDEAEMEVKCVLVTTPAPEQTSEEQGLSLESEEGTNSDDLELVEGSDSSESPEGSDHDGSTDEDSYETNEQPPVELPDSIKITTEGIAYLNAKYQFKVYKWTKNNGEYYKVEFNDEVKCTKVEVDNTLIWKFRGGYRIPLTILYEPDISLVLKFYDGYSKYDKPANTNEWLEECDIKLYTTDPYDISKAIKLNDTQYKTTKEGNQYSFEFKQGVECDEVRFVEKKPDPNDPRRIRVIFKTVWKRWSSFGIESETNDFFPRAIKYKNRSRVILVFHNGILIRERDMNNNWHTLNDEIKMYTFHPRNSGEMVEMDHSQFLKKTLDGPINFEFKPKVKCVKVKVDEEVIWSHEDRRTLNRFPTELSYGKYISRLTLRFDSFSLVFFKFRGGWTKYKRENDTDVNFLSSTVDMGGFPTVWHTMVYPRSQVPQSISTDFSDYGIAWNTFGEFIDQEVYNTNDPWSFPTGWHTYDYGGVEKEPKTQQDTAEELLSDIEIIDASDQRSPFSSSSTRTGQSRMEIVDGVNRTSKAKRHKGIITVEDPRDLVPEGGRSTVDDIPLTRSELIDLILSMNEEFEQLKRYYSDLMEQLEKATTQENRTPITLDISSEESTNKVKCSTEGGTIVFTPSLPYTFRMVKRNTMVIWHTLKASEYSNKVEVTSNDKVIVHKVDGKKEEMEMKAKKEHVTILNGTTPPLKGLYDDEIEMESDFMRELQRKKTHRELEGARKKHASPKQEPEGIHSASSSSGDDQFDIDLVDPVDDSLDEAIKGLQLEKSEHVDGGRRLLKKYQEPTQQPQQPKIAHTAEPERLEAQEASDPKFQLITLDLMDRKSNEYVRYEVNQKKRREKFTCIPPNRVFNVVHNGVHVWATTDQKYPDRVLVKPGADGNQMAYMFFPGDIDEGVDDGPDVEESGVGQPQSLGKDSGPVQDQLEPVQPLHQQQGEQKCCTLITVRVDQWQTTSEVDYEFDEQKEIHRFIAKEWCLIERVVKGNKVIWTPNTEYGIEVEVKFGKDEGEKDKLTVYFPSEEEKSQKNPKNPSKAEVNGSQP
ncbi:hypothetical protein MACJ_001680 [Theileria orientalis]|uniref:SfiI-subtelomeric related protein family member n=1 Tax=Theileria orientalis TaxID=68886 RepID=A0A976M922_THEOR|nr:hypothetical protein MACJ_001680 [Theileria orientalis]